MHISSWSLIAHRRSRYDEERLQQAALTLGKVVHKLAIKASSAKAD